MILTHPMHWTLDTWPSPPVPWRARRCPMLDNSVLPRETLRHGAYICLRPSHGADPPPGAAAPLPALAAQPWLENTVHAPAGPPAHTIPSLRRPASPGGPPP